MLEEALFDRLWDETTARIRNLKVRTYVCVSCMLHVYRGGCFWGGGANRLMGRRTHDA